MCALRANVRITCVCVTHRNVVCWTQQACVYLLHAAPLECNSQSDAATTTLCCQPSRFSRDYTGIYTSLPISREFTSLSRFSSPSILSPRVWCFHEILPKACVMREAYVQSAYTYTYILQSNLR